MLGRLTGYLDEKPGRAARIVLTQVIALILVIAGSMYVMLDLGRYPEPPYPSEATPLSLVDDGVRWDNPLMFAKASYNTTKWLWNCAAGHLGGSLAYDSQQAELCSGSSATVVHTAVEANDMSYWVNLTIHDSTGDGVPGGGDYIIFTGEMQQSDTVYVVALAYVGNGSACAEYSYAIHNGEFYSWSSDTARTYLPWWYWLYETG